MRRRLGVCLVVGLLLTGGCLGLNDSGGSGPDGPANTTGETSQSLSALVESHEQAVLDGPVRVVQTLNQTVERDGQNSSVGQRTVVVGSVDGAAYQRRTVTNTRSYGDTTTRTESYREANGTVYDRDRSGTGQAQIYTGTAVGSGPDVRSVATVSGDLFAVGNVSYEFVGTETVAGVTGEVWRAEGTTALGSAVRAQSNGTVESFESVVVGSPEGYIEYARTRVVGTNSDGTRFESEQTVRWRRVGDAVVPAPDWLDEARAQAAKPGPNDVVTETFSYDGPDGVVELNVTAVKYSLSGPGAPELQRLENPVFVNEFTNQSRVGQPVRAYWLSAEDVQTVELTFHYDETAVPGGNESALAVVSENRNTPLFDRFENSTVDPERDTVTVTLSGGDALDRWQGQQFFVLQWNRYLETVQNQ